MRKKIHKHVNNNVTHFFTIGLIVLIVLILLIVRSARDTQTVSIMRLPYGDSILRLVYLDKHADPGLYMALGDFYFGRGAYDIQKAEYYYTKALSLDERYELANYQLARVHFIRGEQADALNYINKEIQYHPDFKRSHYIRGLVYGYTGKLDLAVQDFRVFLGWEPASWAGHNDLAWVYFQQGDFRLALETAKDGLKYYPGNPWLLNTVGTSLKNLGDAEGARTAFLQARVNMAKLTPEDWGKAYPGNDPSFYNKGLGNMQKTIENNIKLLEENRN